jgi:uncharacterized protein (TIGR02145 family)
MSGSKAVMVAGDIDHDEKIFVSDYNSWANRFGVTNGYFISDLDMDKNVFVSDYNKWASNFGSKTNIGTGRCSFTDPRDGHVYKCVVIGTQTWMAENLAYLPSVSPPSSESEAGPYYYVFGYEGSIVASAKATANYVNYGAMYNWPAALTACPPGWHLATDEEWKVLEKNQGMTQSDADASGWRNTGLVGGKLKEAAPSHWFSQTNNSSGFTALPGGYTYNGAFFWLGYETYFWTASEFSSFSYCRSLYYGFDGVSRGGSNRSFGFSARCLQN